DFAAGDRKPGVEEPGIVVRSIVEGIVLIEAAAVRAYVGGPYHRTGQDLALQGHVPFMGARGGLVRIEVAGEEGAARHTAGLGGIEHVFAIDTRDYGGHGA